MIRIELTDDGHTALRELRRVRRSAAEEILAPLTAGQRAVLGGLLDALVDGTAEGHDGTAEGHHGTVAGQHGDLTP
ncbi:MarR family transcriptional regulator OS=Streptomyces fumanus OX=67302 GN=GCM10018772_67440 PE=4 SV=1 [Streptomyces fumanus]